MFSSHIKKYIKNIIQQIGTMVVIYYMQLYLNWKTNDLFNSFSHTN